MCYVGIETLQHDVALDLQPMDVKVHFIQAVRATCSSAPPPPPLHATLLKLTRQPIVARIVQKRKKNALVCTLVPSAQGNSSGIDEHRAGGRGVGAYGDAVRGEGVATEGGRLRLSIEWGDGLPMLSGKVGSLSFSSVFEDDLLAAWTPQGNEEEEDMEEETKDRFGRGGKGNGEQKNLVQQVCLYLCQY